MADTILPLHEESRTRQSIEHSRGFSELAFLISTDQDFSVFRRFDELSARNLLSMQFELIQIDKELHALDGLDLSGQLSGNDKNSRDALMARLQPLMKKYRKLIFVFWVDCSANAMVVDEALIIQHKVHQLDHPNQTMANRFDLWIRNASEKKAIGEVKREDYEPTSPLREPATHYWRIRDYAFLKSPSYEDTWLERWTRKYLGYLFRVKLFVHSNLFN
jgi:hypothetical protein